MNKKKKEIITKLSFLIKLNEFIVDSIEPKTEFDKAIKIQLKREFDMWIW